MCHKKSLYWVHGSKLSVTLWKAEFAANMNVTAWCSKVAEKQMDPYKGGKLSPTAALGQDTTISTKKVSILGLTQHDHLCIDDSVALQR